jgi:hypothetical protein
MNSILFAALLMLLGTRSALAHCPLCTLGAGGAAALAAYLGIGAAPVGVFVGAFALAIGLWTAKFIRKRLVRGQDNIFGAASFASVVLPVSPLMGQYSPLYVPWMGDYGRTFLIDNFLVGAVVGAAVLYVAPFLSKRLGRIRGNKMFPFQGMIITLVTLLLASATLELSL